MRDADTGRWIYSKGALTVFSNGRKYFIKVRIYTPDSVATGFTTTAEN
jgi:hypothetical protein